LDRGRDRRSIGRRGGGSGSGGGRSGSRGRHVGEGSMWECGEGARRRRGWGVYLNDSRLHLLYRALWCGTPPGASVWTVPFSCGWQPLSVQSLQRVSARHGACRCETA
jgi:hypothetical protein